MLSKPCSLEQLSLINAFPTQVLGITRKPDLVIAMSLPVLNAALRDANQLCIPTIGIADTDCDPNSVTIAIPGNDDSEVSILKC